MQGVEVLPGFIDPDYLGEIQLVVVWCAQESYPQDIEISETSKVYFRTAVISQLWSLKLLAFGWLALIPLFPSVIYSFISYQKTLEVYQSNEREIPSDKTNF